MLTLTPPQFADHLRQPGVVLLDVRTDEEVALARLEPPGLHIPLHELPARLRELDPARPLAIYCHHGVRSEHAGRFLEQRGFTDVVHLGGGIDAWSLQVDPATPRY